MTRVKTQSRTKFKVTNIYLDLSPEEKEAALERKYDEVARILTRHQQAGTLFIK